MDTDDAEFLLVKISSPCTMTKVIISNKRLYRLVRKVELSNINYKRKEEKNGEKSSKCVRLLKAQRVQRGTELTHSSF